MNPLTVVLLGAGGSVSQGIHKALRFSRMPVRVVAASMDPLGAGLYAGDRAVVAPALDDPSLIDWLVSLCEREGARAVLSGVEPLLSRLAPAAEEVRRRCEAVCVVSPPAVLELGDDKLATCRWLREHGLPHPRFAAATDGAALDGLVAACGFPLLAKPRRGHAAQGIALVHDTAAVAGRDDLVIEEPLRGVEYTAGCVCDAGGELRGTIVMRRELREGTTVRAWVGDFPAVRDVAEAVVRALRPVGPCNVQLREHDGAIVPFELNVRFSGTTPARTRFGFPEVEATLRHLVLGEPFPELPRVTEGVMVRYWNEVYPAPEAVAALEAGGPLDDRGGTVFEDWGAAALRVLVTGASGFVGTAIARRLLADGHEVVGLSRRPGAVEGLHGLLEANLADPALARRAAERLDRCEAVVHAGAALPGRAPAAQLVLTNALGTQQVLELAESWRACRLVYLSSLPVIGRPRELPVTEEHPVAPPTPYHATKLLGERLVALSPVPAVSLRLTAPVGPGMPEGRIVSRFVSRALADEPLEVAGEGTRAQDYVDVRDVAGAVAAALERDAEGVLIVGAGRAISNLALARRCVEVLASHSDVRLGAGEDPEEGVRWEVSIERARERLAWAPEHDLADSIAAVADELRPSRGR